MPNYPSPFPLPPSDRVETSIHIVQFRTARESRDGWMGSKQFNGGQR